MKMKLLIILLLFSTFPLLGQSSIEPIDSTIKKSFHLKAHSGINYSNLTVKPFESSVFQLNYSNNINFRIGIEAEYILPFLKENLSVFLDPTFHYYNQSLFYNGQNSAIEYQSFELPFGLRFSYSINDNSKIYTNGLFVYDIPINSKISFDVVEELEISSSYNIAFGLGYQFKKVNIEIRYFTPRNLLSNYEVWFSEYKSTALIIGYTF